MKSILQLSAFFIALIFNFSGLFAQNPCGTKEMTSWFKWYVQNRDNLQLQRGGDTTWLYVPMTVQITGTDEGSGYFNMESAIIAIDNMNRQFKDAYIRFYLVPGDPFRHLNNSAWHIHNFDGGYDLIETNRLPDRINAYVVQDPAGNCGYAWIDAIVLGKNCSGPYNSTWSHGVGHHLSLPHTFQGWEDTSWDFSQPAPNQINWNGVEKVDGSNCGSAGDFFCDTRPDYLSYRWSCNQDLESTVLQHDPNGVPFRSDATFFMSYSLDACASRFSAEQIEAMRSNILTEHASYLQIFDPLQEISDNEPVVLVSPLDTLEVPYNNITFSWNPVPNASLYTVEVYLRDNMVGKVLWQTVYNETSLTVTTGLPNNRLLYWRVRPYSEWDLSKQLAPQQVGVFSTKNTTATNELEKKVIAELAPNPVSRGSLVQLNLQSETAMEAQLRIIDATGRILHQSDKNIWMGDNTLEIPTESLQAGVYQIILQNQLGSLQKRLLIF